MWHTIIANSIFTHRCILATAIDTAAAIGVADLSITLNGDSTVTTHQR